MSEISIHGMVIAPNVVETIIAMAARDVDGVASVGDPTTSGIMTFIGGGKPSTQGIEVEKDENDALHITISLHVKSGYVLPDLAANVRQAIADAANTQVGVQVSAVDVFIDGIQFEY